MVILGVGVYEIPESWYLNLVCPLSASVITTVWLSLSFDWYDEYKELTFDEWYCLYEDEINIELAENGADRELDFDSELEFENRYQNYLNKNKDE